MLIIPLTLTLTLALAKLNRTSWIFPISDLDRKEFIVCIVSSFPTSSLHYRYLTYLSYLSGYSLSFYPSLASTVIEQYLASGFPKQFPSMCIYTTVFNTHALVAHGLLPLIYSIFSLTSPVSFPPSNFPRSAFCYSITLTGGGRGLRTSISHQWSILALRGTRSRSLRVAILILCLAKSGSCGVWLGVVMHTALVHVVFPVLEVDNTIWLKLIACSQPNLVNHSSGPISARP